MRSLYHLVVCIHVCLSISISLVIAADVSRRKTFIRLKSLGYDATDFIYMLIHETLCFLYNFYFFFLRRRRRCCCRCRRRCCRCRLLLLSLDRKKHSLTLTHTPTINRTNECTENGKMKRIAMAQTWAHSRAHTSSTYTHTCTRSLYQKPKCAQCDCCCCCWCCRKRKYGFFSVYFGRNANVDSAASVW